jgi:hypothetical protein
LFNLRFVNDYFATFVPHFCMDVTELLMVA